MQEGISRREPGPFVAFLEGLHLGDADSQQDSLTHEVRALVMGCPSGTIDRRFELARMQERTRRSAHSRHDCVVQRDRIFKRQVFEQDSVTGQMTIASLVLFPAFLENLSQLAAENGIVPRNVAQGQSAVEVVQSQQNIVATGGSGRGDARTGPRNRWVPTCPLSKNPPVRRSSRPTVIQLMGR